ncbi:MAG: P1 family peptidase [Planctomycetes bacterium]|nr:P1 family peptidase [Planctomycetota bacterium]
MSTRRRRIRELGVNIWKHPAGRLNLITDVPGTAVGHASIVRGQSREGRVNGVVRTGVTALVFPGRDVYMDPVRAAVHVINGYGKATGLDQLRETGRIETPVCITNTLSVWTAAETLVKMVLEKHADVQSVCPVVGECNDGYLNDIRGFHVKPHHVRKAVESARKIFELGSTGAGTGMRGLGYKAGVGSASRMVEYDGHMISVGVLTVVNTGNIEHLRIAGTSVGIAGKGLGEAEKGSIIFIVATDGNFTSRQLRRLAGRVTHGLARTGMTSGHRSGDYAIAVSTCDAPEASRRKSRRKQGESRIIREEDISVFFEAVIEATEESYLDGVLTAETVDGIDGHRVEALDTGKIEKLLTDTGLRGDSKGK